ncbi:TlyA family RNA methyltransferase [Algicella marina]|uniref:TlyA family rRNA (Cytidine-2'-O)-methyltransferase n=1 Tax=Algicella marina TaxID=2683284 RepID=A0A6P1T2N3_9RHOB|nr:TlyA family RNA methyltransferase [Algicella marina]QHQ36978.1 TlyA family rRNA (cytidine-2'-O)-methyltransferase [Algicella marina]
MSKDPIRLDLALVRAGLAESRSRAQMLIGAGAVRVNGVAATKPSQPVTDEALEVEGNPLPWVSRAALKLVAALEHFELDPGGAIALDIGASTGGFTEVLRAHGARRVYAVDVGRGQLHASVRADPGVVCLEGLDARNLTDEVVLPDWVVSDVSFISATKALPVPLSLARPGAHAIILVKPQFELSPADIGKGGIVRSEEARARACDRVREFVTGEGWDVLGLIECPVTGSDGNQEYLLAAEKVTPPAMRLDPDAYSSSRAGPLR